MAWRAWGNVPINSTGAGTATNPDTTTLVAEIDSTQLGTANFAIGQSRLYMVTWVVGGSTNISWQLDQATSTALGSIRDSAFPITASMQSAQFTWTYNLERNDRLRARVASTTTSVANAKIIAEPLV